MNDTDGGGFGDQVIDLSKNTGRADAFVPASEEGIQRLSVYCW